MAKYNVHFYEKENGERPVEEFILKSNAKMRAKIVGLLGVLEEKGNLLRKPYSKHLMDGVFEIRCKVGSDITRILYFFYYGERIILTNGFVKKNTENAIKGNKAGKEKETRLHREDGKK